MFATYTQGQIDKDLTFNRWRYEKKEKTVQKSELNKMKFMT